MAQTTLDVYLGDLPQTIGVLWFEAKGHRAHSSFRYTPAWLSYPKAFAIAPCMPLQTERMFFKATDVQHATPLPPPIADTSPEAWGRSIIRMDSAGKKSAARYTEPLNEMDYLCTVDDFSRLGALRLREQGSGVFLNSGVKGKHATPPLLHLDQIGVDIASVEGKDPDSMALRRLRQVGTSLGGARPKCSVIDHDGSLAIAKFTSRRDQHAVERAEVATLRLAKMCGLDVPISRIEMSAGLPVAIIQRFDRQGGKRFAYISAQSMLHSPNATGASYTQIAEAIRQHAGAVVLEHRELFARVGFSILVSNCDDHLKNHGFLYVGRRKWHLAPLFDVNPAPERLRELKTAIAHPAEPDAAIDLLIAHAEHFSLSKDEGARLLRKMAQTITLHWRAVMQEVGMSKAEIKPYAAAFEHEQSTIALREVYASASVSPEIQDDSPKP